MNSHLPRPEKSRLLTVAMVAMAAKITPVPPKAIMMSDGPFEKPEHEAQQARQHQAHEEREAEQHDHADARCPSFSRSRT